MTTYEFPRDRSHHPKGHAASCDCSSCEQYREAELLAPGRAQSGFERAVNWAYLQQQREAHKNGVLLGPAGRPISQWPGGMTTGYGGGNGFTTHPGTAFWPWTMCSQSAPADFWELYERTPLPRPTIQTVGRALSPDEYRLLCMRLRAEQDQTPPPLTLPAPLDRNISHDEKYSGQPARPELAWRGGQGETRPTGWQACGKFPGYVTSMKALEAATCQ